MSDALDGASISVLFDARPFETNVDSNGKAEDGFFVSMVRILPRSAFRADSAWRYFARIF